MTERQARINELHAIIDARRNPPRQKISPSEWVWDKIAGAIASVVRIAWYTFLGATVAIGAIKVLSFIWA